MVHTLNKLSEEIAYNGRRKVSKTIFQTPTGEKLEYEIRLTGKSANILAETEGGKFLIVKQFRVGPNKILRDFPGGGIDKGEKAIVAAERELLEETGYKGNIKFVSKTYTDAYSTKEDYLFTATKCKYIQPPAQNYWEVEKLDLNELLLLLKSGNSVNTICGYAGLIDLGYIK